MEYGWKGNKMKRNPAKETVLYYTPQNDGDAARLKGVLVRMGVRIRNVGPGQVMEPVGSLLGLPGYEKEGIRPKEADAPGGQAIPARENQPAMEEIPEIAEQMLVMHNFSSSRLDALLLNLRKAGVPKISLKAVVTETNAAWTFYRLYEEIKEEHGKMQGLG